MKLGILYSGGKDSTLALIKAQKEHDIVCLITIASQNKESYMFHTPNIDLTLLQSQAMNIPLIRVQTKGQEEKELDDLKNAIKEAITRYKIDGIATGAVRSTYQATRIQKICHELNLWCFNPLWLKNQVELLYEIVEKNITAIITGVFAEPLDEKYLGKQIDIELVKKLAQLEQTHKINPAGEGGEIETTVLDAPIFNKKITITKSETKYKNYSGTCDIIDAKLEKK